MPPASEHPSPGGAPLRASASPAIEAAAAKWFALRDAGLSPDQERALARWLRVDPRHAEALGQLECAWSTFGKPARSGNADQLLKELAGRRRRRGRTRLLAAAAAIVLAVLGVAFAPWRSGGDVGAAPALAVLHRPSLRTLADGSKVTLRDGADVTIDFTATQRRILLQRGEALFEVKKDQARPFIVVANGVAVRAVGTAFAVHSVPGAVDVLVTEGVVSVGSADSVPRENSGAPVESQGQVELPGPAQISVSAGNRVLVDLSAAAPLPQPEIILPDEIDRRLGWRAPRVEFSGMPLAEAVELLNREAADRTSQRILIEDPEIGSMRVSGVFRTDNLAAFLFLLENGFRIKVAHRDNRVVLSKTSETQDRRN